MARNKDKCQKKNAMKAYTVVDAVRPEDGCEIVFAENAGKAKSIAVHYFDFSVFTDLRAYRAKSYDLFYRRDKVRMDWDDEAGDRIIMCKLGMYCYDPRPDECKQCIAQNVCDWWKDNRAEYDDPTEMTEL